MTQLVITLKDQSYLPNIRRIVKSLQGVESVSTSRNLKPVQKKLATTERWNHANPSKGVTDPLEALESIGDMVRCTGKTSEQLIGEYLTEKYGV